MKQEYEHILVAVDGSENSHLAFRHAVEVAKRNQASLYVLQIINDQSGSYSPFAYGNIVEEEQKAVEAEMEKYLSYAENHRLENVTPVIKIGNPKTIIARSAPAKLGVDLIIIGSTGKGVVNRMLIGSTTNYVVQHAQCNVLVVKNPSE